MEKTGLILNDGFVNYNRNKFITFTPNVDIIERGYGKTLMYDFIYQGNDSGDIAQINPANSPNPNHVNSNWSIYTYQARAMAINDGRYTVIWNRIGPVHKFFGDDTINVTTQKCPFILDDTNILYDIPYSDLRIGGGFYGFSSCGYYRDRRQIVRRYWGLDKESYQSDKWIILLKNLLHLVCLVLTDRNSITDSVRMAPLFELNNNIFVYGDLQMWGALSLMGENGYMYNSGRMIDTFLQGNDAQYFKSFGFPDERLPWGGMNYTYGDPQYLPDDGEVLIHTGNNPQEYLAPNTGDSHLSDGTHKHSQRNKIYLKDDMKKILKTYTVVDINVVKKSRYKQVWEVVG